MPKKYDLICMGRNSIDLYANDIGAPFEEITSFAALVGGSPTNISVGTHRLGLRSIVLTAVGEDKVGDFVLHFLNKEGVITDYVPRKPGTRTPAVLLGIQPPDNFPLIFYRDNASDIQLTIDDVLNAPIAECRMINISGTALSKEPSRSATQYAAEIAQANDTEVLLDIDYRPDQWHDARAFGVTTRVTLPLVDIAIGTADEIKAAATTDDPEAGVQIILQHVRKAVVYKLGEDGCAIYTKDGAVHHAAPFKVDVLNVLGAGDSFASGFIYGYLQGWDWVKAGRMGNATGAIVVTRQGCANDMATLPEAMAFIDSQGGF
ncbi:MAG: 5-dehydro-2-deoxygluconokinase [Chloroflexi bacterium]|nr:MAG: 5-dehydro-2-deoxygluconokinase [Chloroflexota bacterium]